MNVQTRICDCWLDVGQCHCNTEEKKVRDYLDSFFKELKTPPKGREIN